MRNGRSVCVDYAGEMGVPVSDLDPALMAWVLVGSEGEGDKGGNGGEGGSGGGSGDGSGEGNQSGSQGGDGSSQGGSGEGGSGDGSGQGADGGDGGEGSGGDDDRDTFDRAYVEKLRKEAADYRTRAKDAEDKLSEREKAELSEKERAERERDEERERGDKLEGTLDDLRLQMAVTNAATAQSFHDPQDALSLIDKETISKNDEGEYNRQSVEAAVKRLADSKPHLVKGKNSGAGSGDGGARGQGGGNMTEEERQKQLQEEYQNKGGVTIPKL